MKCFADMGDLQENLTQFGRKVRSRIIPCAGIRVVVDNAGTKTHAKRSNHTVK
ncbi:hypothetical protein D3C76_874870 [compost metagenome]